MRMRFDHRGFQSGCKRTWNVYDSIMKKKAAASAKRKKAVSKKSGWVIGHARFTKISAVEGIVLSPGMKARKSELDRTGASAEKRRETIIKAYKR